MPEFTGGQPEDYYGQHKADQARIDALNAKQAAEDENLRIEQEVYDQAKAEGAHHQDLLDLKPNEFGYNQKSTQIQADLESASELSERHLEKAAQHFQNNEAAYKDEAQALDAQGIQDIAGKHRGEDE